MRVYYDTSCLIAFYCTEAKQPCRSFDLMHVAVAVVSKVRKFATIDSDQAKLARAAGLMPVEF